MTSNSEYGQICNDISMSLCTQQTLNVIKDNFRQDIDSSRTLEKIRNIRSLIRVLEKRDCLDEGNIRALRLIAESLRRYDCLAKIDNYVYNPAQALQMNDPHFSNVLQPISSDPIERIYDIISNEIGHRWKDFARHLDISEGAIDSLESVHGRRIPAITREILDNHRRCSEEKYWKVELFDALHKSRRRDLSLKVQNILASYSLL